jgi:uncharacterized protein (DUF2062 family)
MDSWPPGMIAVVPVYNHASTVAAVVHQLVALGAPVLVVDDGSTDGSGAAAAAAGAEVERLEANQGKGAALRRAFALASARGYRSCLSCDADLQHPPEAIQALIVHARTLSDPHTIVVGSREMSGAPRVSRFGRRWSDLWTWIACGVWPGDSQCGLRIYPLPDCTLLPITAQRYAFEVEILVRAVWAGMRIEAVDVPVAYPSGRISHFRACADNRRTAAAFARLVTRRMIPLPHRRLVVRPRLSVREIVLGGLQPLPAGLAAGLGAAIAVAPVPGLQSVLTAFIAWRLGLNLPLALLMSNLSFGPLLPMWAALSCAIGMWLRLGEAPWTYWQALSTTFASHALDLAGVMALGRQFLIDWLLGSLVVVPLVAALTGSFAYLVARSLVRDRRGP